MSIPGILPGQGISRRRFLTTATCGAAGLALYGGEFERHKIELTHQNISVQGLPEAFDGFTIAQLSDVHLDEYTEPFLLREAVDHINRLKPDIVLLTGDYVSYEVLPKNLTVRAAWQCGSLLGELDCTQRYAVFGNHDVMVGEEPVGEALKAHGMTMLRNAAIPLERSGGRIWIAGIDDPVMGNPDLDKTLPASIRKATNEPVVMMCHAPDYVDEIVAHPAAKSVALIMSGHTHGGQVRLPFVGALRLPPGGKKYVQGLFQLGHTQLYVNRGLGSVGLPVRFDCPPEITSYTLRKA